MLTVSNNSGDTTTLPTVNQVNRVPACLAGVKVGHVHLCRVTVYTEQLYTPYNLLLLRDRQPVAW